MRKEKPIAVMPDGLVHPSYEVHRVVIASISDAVFITDDKGVFTYICPNVWNIFGYTFEETAKLGNIRKILGKNLPPASLVAQKGEFENLEMDVRDSQGKIHTLLVNIKKVSVENGTILYTCRDITERKRVENGLALENKRLFDEVVRGRNKLRSIARREVEAKERERERISRELHDEAGQYLTALKMSLSSAKIGIEDGTETEKALEKVKEALKLTDAVTDRIRRIAQGLRPPALDAVGIRATLAGLCREVSRQDMYKVEYSAENIPEPHPDAAIILYRVLQEALTNCTKHSGAAKVEVNVRREGDGICLTVKDDGTGFNFDEVLASGEGLGLAGMAERVDFLSGSLEIDSGPGLGTKLTVRLPGAMLKGEPE